MWIRSKNKEVLLPLGKLLIHERYNDNVKIEGYYIACTGINIGMYETKERCIEILNDIENLIPNYKDNSTFIMPQE